MMRADCLLVILLAGCFLQLSAGSSLVLHVRINQGGNWSATLCENSTRTQIDAVVIRPSQNVSSPVDVVNEVRNATLASMMAAAQRCGIKVLGLVTTQGRTKPIANALAEVTKYRQLYTATELSGFYVDHQVATASSLTQTWISSYDGNLSVAIRNGTAPNKLMYLNPKRQCATGTFCLNLADVVMTFDGSFSEWLPLSSFPALNWTGAPVSTSPERFSVNVWSVSNASALRTVIVVSLNASISRVGFTQAADAASLALPFWLPAAVKIVKFAPVLLKQTRRRGMYVSLDTTSAGQCVFSTNASWAVNELILLNSTKVTLLLNRLVAQGFNALSLYNMHGILGSSTKTALLRNFMARARSSGIDTIEAIAATNLVTWDCIAAYQNASNGNTSVMFDGIVTEIEFWNNGGVVTNCTLPLQYIRSLRPKPRFADVPFTYNVYIGWPSQSDVDALIQAGVTGLFTHAYVVNPQTAAGYMRNRLTTILAADLNATVLGPAFAENASWISITPIFAAEGQTIRAGSESFMGDWLMANGPQSIPLAERITLQGMRGYFPWAFGQMSGFQWFSDFFVRVYTVLPSGSGAAPGGAFIGSDTLSAHPRDLLPSDNSSNAVTSNMATTRSGSSNAAGTGVMVATIGAGLLIAVLLVLAVTLTIRRRRRRTFITTTPESAFDVDECLTKNSFDSELNMATTAVAETDDSPAPTLATTAA